VGLSPWMSLPFEVVHGDPLVCAVPADDAREGRVPGHRWNHRGFRFEKPLRGRSASGGFGRYLSRGRLVTAGCCMGVERIRDEDRPSSNEEMATRLKEAERLRFEAEAKYEALMKQLPAAIYVYSPELDGPTFHMSPYIEELLGVSPETFTDNEDVWDELIHPEDRDRARIEYEWFLRTGQPEAGNTDTSGRTDEWFGCGITRR
jgi:PAS domain-containing protein